MKNTSSINRTRLCFKSSPKKNLVQHQHHPYHRSCDHEEVDQFVYSSKILGLSHFHFKSPAKLKRYSSQATIVNCKIQKQKTTQIDLVDKLQISQVQNFSPNHHSKSYMEELAQQSISNKNDIGKIIIPKISFQLKSTVSTECQENIQTKTKSKEVPNFIKKKSSNLQVSPPKMLCPQVVKLKNKAQYMKKQQEKLGNSRKKMTLNNFQIIKKLGEGKFGKVYLVREKITNFLLALKIVDKRKITETKLLNQFIRQLKIQTYLQYPYITKIYGFFDDIYTFYILLENGCTNLYSYMQKKQLFTQEQTSIIIRNLLETINFMHSNSILHRDIKPENILVTHGHVKLCDFGWANNKSSINDLRDTFCGTPLYLSPEILKGEKYDEKIDLWAIGVLTYELSLGSSPFQIETHNQLDRIIYDKVKYPQKNVSSDFKDFIEAILQKNPKKRKSGKELLTMKFIVNYQQLQICEKLCNPLQQNIKKRGK